MRAKQKIEFPFDECKTCKSLEDCPRPDLSDNLLGEPMIPDVCPKPILVMRDTLKKHKTNHKLIREN